MDKDKKKGLDKENEKRKMDENLDRELEQTFPASDPPSHSRPEKEGDKRRKSPK